MGKQKTFFILSSLIIIGLFLRFYNLTWGAPYYFHPDERNIASSITQLSFPDQMNPHFFAYGSLPIYTVYILGVLSNYIQNFFHTKNILSVSFEEAILMGRMLSSILSIGLIPLLYVIGKHIRSTKTGLVAAFFATTSIGFIQYAHFSTFEIWLTFFSTLLFFLFLLFLQHPSKKMSAIIGIVFGMLVGIKISSLALLFPIGLLFLSIAMRKKKTLLKKSLSLFLWLVLFVSFSILTFVVSNPFVVITSHEFIASMNYESSVATGTLPVFYTQEFINTTPIIYHIQYVFLFLLNPLLLFLFPPACIYLFYIAVRKKSVSLCFLLLFFFTLFLSQAFFFVKWTRYMIPVLPFIYLILAIALSDFSTYIYAKKYVWRLILNILFICFFIVCFFYTGIFFYTTYMQQDTRVAAMQWAKTHIDSDTKIVSEVYDLGIVPFNAYFPNITLFNFYELDNNTDERNDLTILQKTTPIVILSSQRIIKTRIKNHKNFPIGYDFYQNLLLEKQYKKIYETPCDIFCRILYFNDPIFSFEDTTAVFDRPFVSIYQKL